MRLIRQVSIPGVLLGLLFFSASLTPSLLPRGALVQGILGGLVMALGYLVWRIVMLLWRVADLPEFRGSVLRWVMILLGAVMALLFVAVLWHSLGW